MLSILGSHCGGALCPPPHPSRLYLHSIHLCIHPRLPLSTDHLSSTHQTSKQPTNQATQTTQPCFSPNAVGTWFALRGRRCALPRTPSRLYLHSIHPSIHPSVRPSIHPSIHPLFHASNQQQANQATNPPKSFIFLPVHDPSMCFPKIQATNKPSRPNQPTLQPKEVG